MLLANPRGFCAGVDRAIAVVDQLLDQHGGPIYVRKEIVHNRQVVERLRARGAIFVEEVEEAPEGSILVFSAHGISPEVRRKAAERRLRVVDATCPLVSKVHYEAVKFAKAGLHVLLIGHADHDEVIGTMGEIPGQITLVEDVDAVEHAAPPDPDRVAVITQTTLSVDETKDIMEAVRRKFPNVRTPARDDICYATQNRQDAVRELAAQCDVMIVVGSPNSSNSLRLRELAEQTGLAVVFGRRSRANSAGVDCRRAARRCDGGRFVAGNAHASNRVTVARIRHVRISSNSVSPNPKSSSRCRAKSH